MLASGEFYGYKRNEDVNMKFQQNIKENMSDQLYLEEKKDNTDKYASVAKQVCLVFPFIC